MFINTLKKAWNARYGKTDNQRHIGSSGTVYAKWTFFAEAITEQGLLKILNDLDVHRDNVKIVSYFDHTTRGPRRRWVVSTQRVSMKQLNRR